MRILLVQIDKTQDRYITDGCDLYEQRLKNYTRFEVQTISMPKAVRQRSVAEQKEAEGALILDKVKNDEVLVLLDEKGNVFDSVGFSKFIAQRQNASTKTLVFLIGGPFGFSEAVYKRANFKVALSAMTFSHQMVRLFFTEQLYRAFTILKGEKYHHS